MDQETRQFLVEQFSALNLRFDAVDQRFGAVDQRFGVVDQRFEAAERTLRVEMQKLRAEMQERIDAAKASMFQRIDEVAASLEEGYRDTQTEVLKAVYSMGERLQLRAGTQDTLINGIQQRQASLETRLLEIEKRLHIPPAA